MAGKDLKQLCLPTPQRTLGDRLSREMLRETSYNLNEYVSANEPLLVVDQSAAYNAILDGVNKKRWWNNFSRCTRRNRKHTCH